MSRWLWLWVVGVGMVHAGQVGVIESRCDAPLPEAMMWLQKVVDRQGYQVMQVQPVGEALAKRGYEGEDFKVLFIGRAADFAEVEASYPSLMPFLPLSLTLAEEGAGTRLTAMPPVANGASPPLSIKRLMTRWRADLTRMARDFNTCP